MRGIDGLGAALAALEVTVTGAAVRAAPVALASYPDGPRPSSTVLLEGGGTVGRGEHVGWSAEAHVAFATAAARVPRGRHRLGAWAAALAAMEPYDRAALEAAAIDLALRQHGTNLFQLAGVAPRPLRYVVSFARTRDPAVAAAAAPEVELKLDVDPAWTAATWASLAGLGRVAVLDWKLTGTVADHERAHRLLPGALLEDPCPGPATWSPSLQARLALDAPLVSAAALDAQVIRPAAVNVKPARMGGVLEAIACLERAAAAGIPAYLGGMFEVGIGRRQLHVLAALACPDGPNDVAPLRGGGPRPRRLAVDGDAPGFG